MSSRIRVIVLSLFAVFALSAIVSASASAEVHWWISCHKTLTAGAGEFNNSACTEAGGTKNFTEKLLAGESAEFSEALTVAASHITLNGIVVTCTGVRFGAGTEPTNAFMEGTNADRIKELQFTGCTVTTPATGCGITNAGGIIKTGEIETSLKEEPAGSGKAIITFKPKAPATTFASLKFKAEAGCKTLSGLTVVVSGETKAEIEKPAECLVGHNLLISEKPSKLTATEAVVEEFVQTIKLDGVENINGLGSEPDSCWDAK
jgi:hypothetical protein